MHDYIYAYVLTHIYVYTYGGGRGKKNGKDWIISKYIVAAYEGGIMKHTKYCWIIRKGGTEKERVVELIWLYLYVKYHG
jgi:hypothetical protein